MPQYSIRGHEVHFPHQPYGVQLSFMEKMLRTLDEQGNALLEAPTGCGKTLSLLCAALAWQAKRKRELQERAAARLRRQVEGGGSGDGPGPSTHSAAPEAAAGGSGGSRGRERRSHRDKAGGKAPGKGAHGNADDSIQIAQVVRELKRTAYKPSMAILAAKQHYCINKAVLRTGRVDEECERLAREEAFPCRFRNKGGGKQPMRVAVAAQVHDIEELSSACAKAKTCPYFTARDLALTAELVFCPYSYLLDPVVRAALGLDVGSSVLIFDEAHNMEDVCREGGSMDLDLDALREVEAALRLAAALTGRPEIYEPLAEGCNRLVLWLARYEERPDGMAASGFEEHEAVWQGPRALTALDEMGLSSHMVAELWRAYEQAKAFEEKATFTTEGDAANEAVPANRDNSGDYRVVVKRWIAHGAKDRRKASGTLAPLDSFASELGTEFHVRLEAPHVVDMGRQVWAGVVPRGPGGGVLSSTFKEAATFRFQDEAGEAVLRYCQVIPDGVLMFVPSYGLLDKLVTRWKATGLWSRLEGCKTLVTEGREAGKGFEDAMSRYYAAVRSGRGGLFMAICRGKASEGIDFADQHARGVILLGIPFPAVKDTKVRLKKEYNDAGSGPTSGRPPSQRLLSGDAWYSQQAFRALNQAVGRCIRHKYDWGAIILLDERFRGPGRQQQLSRWVRAAVKAGAAGSGKAGVKGGKGGKPGIELRYEEDVITPGGPRGGGTGKGSGAAVAPGCRPFEQFRMAAGGGVAAGGQVPPQVSPLPHGSTPPPVQHWQPQLLGPQRQQQGQRQQQIGSCLPPAHVQRAAQQLAATTSPPRTFEPAGQQSGNAAGPIQHPASARHATPAASGAWQQPNASHPHALHYQYLDTHQQQPHHQHAGPPPQPQGDAWDADDDDDFV
eukprot:XP_001694511.1 ATP-dependent DNA helicase [Chlamydomonas reinhardtii]